MQSNDVNDVIGKGKEGERIKSKFNHWLHPCLVFELVKLGVKLDESDLKRVADLWTDVINPACLKFEAETGKPAEALREAIAAGFERRGKKVHRWNAWERLWWSKVPHIEDKSIISTLLPHCNCPPLTTCITQTYSTTPVAMSMKRRLRNDTTGPKLMTGCRIWSPTWRSSLNLKLKGVRLRE